MWFVIMAVLITPFLPTFLKGKCPSCSKRKLDTFEPEGIEAKPGTYITYFLCQNCHMSFRRDKSGPLEAMPADLSSDGSAAQAV
jgi:transposase-like protein